MVGGGEPCHVGAGLGDDDMGDRRADPGDGGQQGHGGLVTDDCGLDLCFESLDRRLEAVDAFEMLPCHEGVPGRESPGQRFGQGTDLVP